MKQSFAHGLSPERLKRLDDIMSRYIEEGQIAGIATLIHRRGQRGHLGLYTRC